MPSVMSALRCMSLCTCSLTMPSDTVTLLQVLESPNDSHPWIRFMAFHVELGEVAKARSVAEKALQTIHFRQALLDVAGCLLSVCADLFDIMLNGSWQSLR